MVKRRKPQLPAIFLTILLWSGFGYLVVNFSPAEKWTLLVFFPLSFFCLFFTFSFFLYRRLSFLLSFFAISFLLLRFFRMENVLNLTLIFFLLTTVEVYFRVK